MKPRSLVCVVCTAFVVLFVGLLMAAGGARRTYAGGDPAYTTCPEDDLVAAGYQGTGPYASSPYGPDAFPTHAEPVASHPAPAPASWLSVVAGMGLLGLFAFLGILALRGTAEDVIVLRSVRHGGQLHRTSSRAA